MRKPKPTGGNVPLWLSSLGVVRTVAKSLAYTIVPVILLSAIAIGVMYVRLRHGPVALDFMVAPVERGINAELVNNSVKIAGAELQLTDRGSLEFRLRNMTVFDRDGDAIGGAPLAAVNISAAALWNLRVVPARIELIDPVIKLIYTDQGGLALDEVINPPEPKPAQRSGGSDVTAELQAPAPSASVVAKSPPKAVNIAKLLSEASRRARRRLDATSYLVEFGVRNATINLDYHGKQSSWQVIEANIDFDHARRRSIISGRARVASSRGPWALSFVTDEIERSDHLEVKATVRDLIPATLAGAAPPLALMGMIDLPVAGDATVKLSTEGDVASALLALEAGRGRIKHPDLDEALNLSGALLKLAYDGGNRTWELLPSPVKWEGGNVLFSGAAHDVASGEQPPAWQFSLDGKNAVVEAPEFSVPPISVDVWTARGTVIPRQGLIDIADARFSGGGGEITLTASTRPGDTGQSTTANVNISPMPLATVKAIWPRAIAPGAREWVGERITAANFKGGTVSYMSGDYLKGQTPDNSQTGERLSATLQIDDATFTPLPGMSPIVAPRGLVNLENNALEISVPESAVVLADDRTVPLKAGRLAATNVLSDRPDAEITFSADASLGPFLETVEQLPVATVQEASPLPKAADGKVKADIKIKLPLISELRAEDAQIEGTAKITDGRFGKVADQFDIQGFTLALELTSSELDAHGDLLVNGVPAKIYGQRMLGPGAGIQPPIKVTAKLDDSDRNQLGLDINDIVHGVVPVEISLQKTGEQRLAIKLSADLKNAEVLIDPVSWRKPPGKSASVEADIVTGENNKTELQNFKVTGDNIALEGWIGIGADNRMREFHFPAFSLNVVSRLKVDGTLGSDNVWKVKASGPTFDGRDVFRSLFSLAKDEEKKSKDKNKSRGTDLNVTIANVIGGNEVSLRNFKMALSTRDEKLTVFDANGTLDGGAALVAKVDTSEGSRRLRVDSVDAGQVMRLVNFYPNMQNGRLRLEVNLDGKGDAEKTGILWVDNFKVLGDPIVSEVVGSADEGRPAIGGRRKVTREVFEFDRMRAPFSTGYGQFVLEESYLKGPLVGANLRGKVDFKTDRVNIGGTYIPLQGLNGALGGIPLLGQILSGAHGEGIFGMTFAVQGRLSNPQVLVNPLSLVAPGIFREVFQMTSQNPSVKARGDEPGSSKRASKSTKRQSTGSSTIVDGWSSTSKKAN